jgi:ABC-2 type transport system permease protein
MQIRRIRALLIKEFAQMKRDLSTLIVCIALPIVLLLIYGFGVSLDFKHLPIGLVMEDRSPDAVSFAKALSNSTYFAITTDEQREPIERKVIDGSLKGMIVIPSYFSSFRQKGAHIAPIQVIADGTNPNTASFVQNYVNATFQGWLLEEKIESNWPTKPLIKAEQRFWYNESVDSRNFILPGSLAITMTLIGTMLTALMVAREWERGTMEKLLSTPVQISEFVLAKLFSYFFLGMVSFLILTFLTVFLFDVPLRGSLFALVLASSVFLITALGTGLLISTLAKSQLVSSQAALNIGFLPAYILSGFLFEIGSMPEPIQWVTALIPARYFVTCLETLFLTGNVWSLLLKNMGIMSLFALGIFLLTAGVSAKRLE